MLKTVMSVTQENAVDLHSVGRIPLHSRGWSGGGYKSCQKPKFL